MPGDTPPHQPYRLPSGHRVAPAHLKHGTPSSLQTYVYLVAPSACLSKSRRYRSVAALLLVE